MAHDTIPCHSVQIQGCPILVLSVDIQTTTHFNVSVLLQCNLFGLSTFVVISQWRLLVAGVQFITFSHCCHTGMSGRRHESYDNPPIPIYRHKANLSWCFFMNAEFQARYHNYMLLSLWFDQTEYITIAPFTQSKIIQIQI